MDNYPVPFYTPVCLRSQVLNRTIGFSFVAEGVSIRSGTRTLVQVLIVKDGDSLLVRRTSGDTHSFDVRLHGIDAPEYDQPLGQRATDYLAHLTLDKSFYLEIRSIDRYQRVVGVLYENDRRHSINRQMVEAGLAYNWPRYGRLYGAQVAEDAAKRQRLGLWGSPSEQVKPWVYRMQKPISRFPSGRRPSRRGFAPKVPQIERRKPWTKTQEFLVGVLFFIAIMALAALCGS